MKIALLHYSIPPIVGGVESVLAQQANLMADAGHHVRVIAGRGEPWRENVELIQIPLVDSRHPEIEAVKLDLDAGHVPPVFHSLVEKLIMELKSAAEGVDVLIAHNVCSLHKNLVLTQALHRLNGSDGFPRLVLWHHDLAWSTPRYMSELHPGEPWDLLRTDWPGVTHVAVSSMRQAELAELLGIPLDRIHVIPNGLDIGRFFKFQAATVDLVKRLHLLRAWPFLLVPVRVTPRKNLELALRILYHLKNQHPDAALVITGPLGPHNSLNNEYLARLLELRSELRLEHSAHFMAKLVDYFLPDEMISDFYQLADALLLTSLEEGFGIPLLEAGLTRRPVFCTDLPPLRALGQDDVHYFSPEQDPREIADSILRYLNDDPVSRFSRRARTEYTWEQIYQGKIEPLLVGVSVASIDKGGAM